MGTWVHVLDLSVAGLSKGVGFIRFDQRVEAERAIQELNGSTPKGSTEAITVKFANNPSNNNKAIPPLAAYLTPQATRRFGGPIHHPTGRFRYIPLSPLSRYLLASTRSTQHDWKNRELPTFFVSFSSSPGTLAPFTFPCVRQKSFLRPLFPTSFHHSFLCIIYTILCTYLRNFRNLFYLKIDLVHLDVQLFFLVFHPVVAAYSSRTAFHSLHFFLLFFFFRKAFIYVHFI